MPRRYSKAGVVRGYLRCLNIDGRAGGRAIGRHACLAERVGQRIDTGRREHVIHKLQITTGRQRKSYRVVVQRVLHIDSAGRNEHAV